MRNLKINKSLVVEIPKRFEKDLKAKFNLRRLNHENAIVYTCPLCDFYYRNNSCNNCPFSKFTKLNQAGCTIWLKKMVFDIGFIVLSRKIIIVTNIERFKYWRKLASKHIVFI